MIINMHSDSISQSKRNIVYTEHKGKFLKKCPGTPGYLCCNYYVLNTQTNCNFDCQYCILQQYINNNQLSIFTNIKQALDETEEFLNSRPDKLFRIGTGELTDSLSLDEITNSSLTLIPFFLKQKNTLLELKTKSNKISNLLKFHPEKKIVASWSVNPQNIIDQYEAGAASLFERLDAATKCEKQGYLIGLHFDPVILYPEWESEYKELIDKIFSRVSPKSIAWISVAGLRYMTTLKNVVAERFPKTKLFLGEMIRCADGKFRYIRPVRTNVYRKMIGWLREYNKDMPIYFCMESHEIWEDVFGSLPWKIGNLKNIF
jgi:spore photoproduct lyase